MAIREINNKEEWEHFFSAVERRTFLNSWDWGEFRKSLGDGIWRKGVVNKDGLSCLFLVSKIKSRKGSFILLAHCPVMEKLSRNGLEEAIMEVKEMAEREKVDFIRIAPIFESGGFEDEVLEKSGFKKSSSLVFPTKSWELDLLQKEENILSGMRKGTRYLINRGLKNSDIEIRSSESKEDLKAFCNLQEKTAIRQGFSSFPSEYIKKEFEIFSKNGNAKLFLGFNKGECSAGAFIIFWGKKAFYHHGASLMTSNEAPVSHLVQWEAIKESKVRDCETYNFWAIAPSDDPKHKWAGLTFFKKGFGGREINYAKTKDFPLSKKYLLTYWVEKLRR